MFSWWCVWVSVLRFFGFVLGGNRFRQCNVAEKIFVFAAASLHKVDLVMLSMQNMKFPYSISGPKSVKEC